MNFEVQGLLKGLKKIQREKYAYWHDAVGETIAKIAEPVQNRKGTLIIKVDDPVWRFELTRRKAEILEKVNIHLDINNKINDIVFR